jgi:hypothetical protein
MLLCVPEAYKAGVACRRLKLERLSQFRRILASREKIQQPVLSPWYRAGKRSPLMRPWDWHLPDESVDHTSHRLAAELIDAIRVGPDLSFDAALASPRAESSGS